MGKVDGFLTTARAAPHRRPARLRVLDWREVEDDVPAGEMREQASRCMDCGVPFCTSGCPLGNLIPSWNVGHPETWGAVGHFKVGGLACDLIPDAKLAALFKLNRGRIAFDDDNRLAMAGQFDRRCQPVGAGADHVSVHGTPATFFVQTASDLAPCQARYAQDSTGATAMSTVWLIYFVQ